MGLVGLAGWVALLSYFAVAGRFEIFWETMVTYNRYYSGNLLLNIIAPLKGKAEILIDVLKPLAVLAAAGPILAFITNRRRGALLIAFILSTWITVACPGMCINPHFTSFAVRR
jgi:hypothetical protein